MPLLISKRKFLFINLDEKEGFKSKSKLRLLFRIFLYLIIIQLSYILIINFLKSNINIASLIKYLNESLNHIQKNNGITYFVLSSLVVAPLIEEGLFRSWINLKKKGIAFFLASLIYKILGIFLNDYNWEVEVIIRLFACLIVFLIMIKIFTNFQFEKIQKKKLILFSYIFSSILFGFWHISLFKVFNIYTVILIYPHILCGFLLGYIRIKNGLMWSVLLHFCINIPATIMVLLK